MDQVRGRRMKTVTVADKQLLVRVGEDMTVLHYRGMSRQFPNSSRVETLADDAYGTSSSWATTVVAPEDEPSPAMPAIIPEDAPADANQPGSE